MIFVNHVLTTILYHLPYNPLTPYYQNYVTSYIQPVFAQNWKMFAPEPPSSFDRFWYRCKFYSRWSEWKDSTHALLSVYNENRLSGFGKILYIQEHLSRSVVLLKTNVVKNCMKDCSDSFFKKKFLENELYQKAIIYTHNLCLKENSKLDAIQFRVARINAKMFSKRKEVNFKPQIMVADFPIHEI